MKKVLTMLIGIALVVTSQSFPAFASIKAGNTCSKAGSTAKTSGYKFTCVKKGKKLVWNSGVALPIPSQGTPTAVTPSATPSASPTQSKVEIEKSKAEKDYEAITSLSRDSSLNTGFKVNTITYESVLPQTTEHLVAKYRNVYNFWSHFVSGLKDITLIIGTGDDVKWLADQIEKFNGHPDDLFYQSNVEGVKRAPCVDFTAGSLFLLTDVYVNTYRVYPKQCASQEPNRPEYIGAPFHEFTHNMQTTLAGDARLLPCWMKEGQATFFETNLGSAGNYEEFTKTKKYWTSKTDKSMIATNLMKLGTNYGDGNCSRDGGYQYGYTAIQVLVNQYGLEKSIDFLKEIKVYKDWKVAFKSIYSVEFEEWLTKSKDELVAL